MRTAAGSVGMLVLGLLAVTSCGPSDPPSTSPAPAGPLQPLPDPMVPDSGSLEAAIAERRSVRGFEGQPLSDAQVGQLLWAAQGITGPGGERAERYLLLEAGHSAQNVLLQATTLELAGVPVGAFDDDDVRATLDLPADQRPLYLLPIGAPAS